MKATPVLLALVLSACGPEAIKDRAPPVAITYALKAGEEVYCHETLLRIGLPFDLLVIGWARRTWRCELRIKGSGLIL